MPGAERKQCARCGPESLLLCEPLYEGFTKVGEQWRCTRCGATYTDAAAPNRVSAPQPSLGPPPEPPPALFDTQTELRLCRYCRHYVVNPFRQWCARHQRDTEATDTCPRFSPPPEKNE
ncbi:MAG: hypothetical protein K9N49_03540 [Candidatus Marinimicrobia bacterium]|nr:hypothetical protein [Candidatus Neomarinimicrobiota bacterium]